MATIINRSLSTPSIVLQLTSIVLPILKCAFCPACLSLFGSAIAGAHLGFLAEERIYDWAVMVALALNFLILWVAFRHHQNRWPLAICTIGGVFALGGQWIADAFEMLGFVLLMLAALLNAVLIYRHRRVHGSCCQTTTACHPEHLHVGTSHRANA